MPAYLSARVHHAGRRARARGTSATTLLAGAALLAGPAPAAAQAADTLRPDTVYDIEPIAVRAVRPTTTTGGVSAITVRLDSVRFRPAPLLEDVLRELPLVQVRTNSRGEAQLALRGAEERQIAILLDGVPLTLGWDHRTDLSVVPMTAAQRIQLVRGMSSVLHGPNVLGGVVEVGLGSVPVVRTDPLQVAAGIDDNGGYALSATSSAELGGGGHRLVVRGGLGHRERDGLEAPANARALYPALAGDDYRVNSDLELTDGFFSARYTPDGHGRGWLSATVSGFDARRGVPPELNDDAPRLWRYPGASRVVAIVAGGLDAIETGAGTASLTLNLGLDLGSTLIEDYQMPADPALATSANDFFRTVAETESSDDRTLTARLKASQELGPATISAAATLADVSHDEVITVGLADGVGTAFPGEYRQRLWSLAAETELPFELGAGFLTGGRLSAGLAYDGADVPEPGPEVTAGGPTMSEWGGRVGLSATTTGASLLVHAAATRRGRFPALREMYSSALGKFEPNPDLRPEVLTALELGFTSRLGRYDVQMVGFHQRLDNAIARGAPPATSDAKYMRVNRDEIRSTGLELLAGYTVGRLTVEGEVTLQSVEVVEPGGEGVRAEYEPEIAGGLGGSLPLIAGIEAAAEVKYWGEEFCSAPLPGQEGYETLEPGTRTDLQLARTFRLGRGIATFQRLGLEVAVDNLSDSTAYDQCGLPRSGRTLRFQLRLN
ncbi:MAG: TonB-dependent receptor plug domain-containing protein [Gemmatimonadota bacterium]